MQKALNGKLSVTVNDKLYALTEILKNNTGSSDLDFESKKTEEVHTINASSLRARLVYCVAKNAQVSQIHKKIARKIPR